MENRYDMSLYVYLIVHGGKGTNMDTFYEKNAMTYR